MAWTVPRRWTVNETVTAAQLNTHLRDNLNASETATVTTAGDLVYATAKNTLARLAAGSARTALTVASGGTAPEWKHSFYPIQVSTDASYGLPAAACVIFRSIPLASYLAGNDAIIGLFFITIYNNTGSTVDGEVELRNGDESVGFWGPAGASITTNAACRGGWFSTIWVSKGSSTSRNYFMSGPRNASIFPLLGAVTDMYFVENFTASAPSTMGIFYNFQANSSSLLSFTVNYAGIWGMRSI